VAELVGDALGARRVGQTQKGVVELVKCEAAAFHLPAKPVVAVDRDLDGAGQPGLQAHVNQAELGMQERDDSDSCHMYMSRFDPEGVLPGGVSGNIKPESVVTFTGIRTVMVALSAEQFAWLKQAVANQGTVWDDLQRMQQLTAEYMLQHADPRQFRG
jgi:hypothetical protein